VAGDSWQRCLSWSESIPKLWLKLERRTCGNARRSTEAAERLLDDLRAACDAIAENPARFAQYPYGGGRYRQLSRFPYIIIFEEGERFIDVFAIAHTNRRPGYWHHRKDS
jgi:plasmid stabilization system protein ParE